MKVSEMVAKLRVEADRVKGLDATLSPLLTEAAKMIEHLHRVGHERQREISQVQLENDVLRMEKKR